ncbi:DNA-damage-inducible protein F [Pseudooceanicola batsensis HTCC2597]|uniref:DNA-damage-inducible protein F n=1 Tax=Pseudooceanicola batsensis (strain ATCC BAA-863 / DSM 15984 / KCTC 12145 / HTCC2597) TaxID=252305 RepID=A3TT79_PSEBH|nr:MATE family efflux transporter [Pseudooceanicola batsensis]EAQ04856.1 DNA-damage-inducible protein F [Pseudooceanicola batsensis HTCC2597]
MADPITHRRVLRIALPIVLSNATVPLLAAVDTGVVGQMGAAAPIGAVGIGGITLTAIYWMFGFLRMGTTGLTANAIGAGQSHEVAALLTRALLIAATGGLALILLQGPIFGAAFALSPASPEVEELARAYMGIRIWSAPAAIAVFGITGWLIAQERTGAVLVVQVLMNGLNMGLDLLFVLGFDWGVSGVATATLIAEWTGCLVGLWLCRAAFRVPAWRDWPRVFDRARLTRMAVVNRDILIRSLLLEMILVSFIYFGSDFGDVHLAANQVLMQFMFITAYAMDGFAFAAEAFVGQALGRRDRAALRRGGVMTGIWGGAICVLMALVFALAGGMIIDLMATAPEVRLAARDYLPWMVAAPLAGCASWMFDGIFIGAARSRDMRNMMAVSFAIYCLAVVTLIPAFGNHGLWMALLVSFIARGATLAWKYPALEASADLPPEAA